MNLNQNTNRIIVVDALYGKMSLTNYICQSIIGSILFFPYAFGLADDLNITFSLCLGFLVMFLQIKFCKYWLNHHKLGPLEELWHKLTWVNLGKHASK